MTWAMMGAYQIIAHALLLNLLIAVFTNTYTRINTGTSSKLLQTIAVLYEHALHYQTNSRINKIFVTKVKALKRCRFGLEIPTVRFIENLSCEVTGDSTIQFDYVSIPNNILPDWKM